ncbi:CynX/NimT family MFS transporter [Nonomuraea aridisoli]|uniref:CynX/NimT family MFS transporter n=1 Tax=Nonomuraea aridisoli TaxID=2070368 RepID=UPI001C65209A|nr:MFS transporter [Nonomuraea aridisoli]
MRQSVNEAPPEATGAARRGSTVLVAVSVILLAVNLRPALVAVSPLLGNIRADTGMSATTAGLLTTLPVVCFGVLSPFAPRIGDRLGANVALLLAMVVLVAGTALRLLPSMTALLLGSVVIGLALAVANVLLPSVIKREFPSRAALMSGVYSMSMFGGAALAAGVTVPVQHAADLGWRAALAFWGLLGVAGVLVWLPQVSRRAGAPARVAENRPVRGLWRHPVAWAVAVFFTGTTLIFYASSAWLPTMLTDAGLPSGTAGWMLSFMSLVAIAGAFFTPILTGRNVPSGVLVVLSALLTMAGFAGVLTAPETATYLWMALLGLGQGAMLSLSVLFFVLRAPDARHTAQLSSMSQCAGYILGSVGPSAVGAVHQWTGDWTVPLVVLIVLGIPMIWSGLGSARKRYASYEIT